MKAPRAVYARNVFGSSFQFCTLLVFTKPHVSDHTKVLVTISTHCMHSIRKKVHETWKTLVTLERATTPKGQRAVVMACVVELSPSTFM